MSNGRDARVEKGSDLTKEEKSKELEKTPTEWRAPDAPDLGFVYYEE